VLSELARVLKSHPDWRFRIDGHTDAIGSDATNLDLSQQRSAAVRTGLVEKFGVPAAQLTTQGLGESKPVDSNEAESGRARNRRVELVRLDASGVATPGKNVAVEAQKAGSACRFGGGS
jgi:OmpA-OmpF porin, OOP family